LHFSLQFLNLDEMKNEKYKMKNINEKYKMKNIK
jgi:hypothetical protein